MNNANDTESALLTQISVKLDAILALLALRVTPEQESKPPRNIDVTLSACGVSNASIARIMGKKESAVRKAVSRARRKKQ